jgi:hypothetical protein
VLDAWRTSCPRLPVWENANDRGFIERRHVAGSGTFVSLSVTGAEHLRTCRGQRVHVRQVATKGVRPPPPKVAWC